ncbi:hypothetical protein BGX28_006764 [Mortierella sp. GBA30]|nr:hypothetical protein BGX28_006764 [Mortierella sp. GBA30]
MSPPFKVLIVGAGVGGVLLAVLLERAKVAYEIFDSASDVSPSGGVSVLGPTVMPLFEQLGLLRQIREISRTLETIHLVQDNMKRIGEVDLSDHKEQYVSRSMVEEEPYDHNSNAWFLISHIPSHKIQFSKRIVTFTANKDEVVIRCADDTVYKGDFLVGADGAFSRVRESLYRQLAKKGILPRNDATAIGETQPGRHVYITGITEPLSPETYPALKDDTSRCDVVIGDHTSYSWSYFTVPGNRVCWNISLQPDDATLREQRPPSPTPSSLSGISSSSNDTWSQTPDRGWDTVDTSIESVLSLEECRSFELPMGGTLGNFIDATPRETISKVNIDETLFDTWHHGRTILIGDACHRMLPNAGQQGAVNAVQDAVILANLIHDLPSASSENLVEMFREFHADRYPYAQDQMQLSHKVNKLMIGQSWTESLMRKFIVRYMSKVYQHFCDTKSLALRSQATFMPMVESRGSINALPQKPHKVFGEEGHSKH